jgi:predicted O-methyltransferase YrrM
MDKDDVEYKFSNDWHSRHVPNWLRFLAYLRGKPLSYLEVGSFEGQSAVWMLKSVLTHEGSSATLIDSFEKDDGFLDVELEQTFARNMLTWMSKITVLRTRSLSALTRLYCNSRVFDVIYVDGSHRATHVLEDLCLSWNMLTPGGLLIADDYQWNGNPAPYGKPELAIDCFCKTYEPEVEVLHRGVQVFIRKKA